MSRSTCIAICLLLAATSVSQSICAGSGAGAINLTFNTSARAEGMGSAGTGLAWGRDINQWANPALLAFRPGLNFLSFSSELAEGLADDIKLTDRQVSFGAWGVTLMFSKNHLDMGEQEGTDESGNPTGTFESYMQAKSWGLGLDLVQLGEAIKAFDDGRYSRYASVAVGYVRKSFEDQLAPDDILQDAAGGGSASGSASDIGVAIRLTPLVLDGPEGAAGNGVLGLLAGGGWGTAHRNSTDQFIVHVDADQADPFPQAFDTGWALHVELPLAAPAVADLGGLAEFIDPVFSWTKAKYKSEPGYVWDAVAQDYVYEHDTSGHQNEWGHGWEIGILNVFYLRRGHFEAPYGDIVGDTEGWGLQLQHRRYGGLRYDHAEVPQATGLPNVERTGFSVWVDVQALFARERSQ